MSGGAPQSAAGRYARQIVASNPEITPAALRAALQAKGLSLSHATIERIRKRAKAAAGNTATALVVREPRRKRDALAASARATRAAATRAARYGEGGLEEGVVGLRVMLARMAIVCGCEEAIPGRPEKLDGQSLKEHALNRSRGWVQLAMRMMGEVERLASATPKKPAAAALTVNVGDFPKVDAATREAILLELLDRANRRIAMLEMGIER